VPMTTGALGVLVLAWGVYVALLLPTLGAVQHGATMVSADRYSYLPCVDTPQQLPRPSLPWSLRAHHSAIACVAITC
jgi:hypothetical protein